MWTAEPTWDDNCCKKLIHSFNICVYVLFLYVSATLPRFLSSEVLRRLIATEVCIAVEVRIVS